MFISRWSYWCFIYTCLYVLWYSAVLCVLVMLYKVYVVLSNGDVSVVLSVCLSICLSKASPLIGHSLRSGGEAEMFLEVETRGPHSGSSTLAHREPHGTHP